MTKAWETTIGSEDIVIAVLDTGVDEAHVDLRRQILPGYNVLAPAESPADDHGHGTAIAGIIAAEANNDAGIAGTCRNCRLLPVKVLDMNGEGTYADLIEGIFWSVHQGARVLNLSLGGTIESQALQDAVDYARSRGAVLVAAGGNSGGEQPIYPAAYGSAIGVGATDSSDHAWRWSGRGPHIRLMAPGVSVWTLAPADHFTRVTGTSAAAAHVSGVVALLLSRDSTLSPVEIEQSLYSSVDDLGPLGRDATYGFGRLNARKAFLVRPNRVHDVHLAGVRIEPSTFQVGDAIQVRATVSNEGNFVEEALEVSLSINRVTLAELRIDALEPGKQQDVLFDWKSALPETGEVIVSARVKAVPGELDSTDNERLQRYGLSFEEGEVVSLYAVQPPTHQWIALQAYNKLTSGQLKTELGQYLPTSSSSSYYSSSFSPSTYGWPNNTNSYASSSAALIEGVWEEDNPETRVLNHFWQPDAGYNAGLLGAYDSALKTALEDRFFTALLVYNTDKAASYYWLGRTVHLLEDMSVPAHTLNDPHLPVDSDNYEGFTSTSENYKLITSSSANTAIPDVQGLPNYPYQTPTDSLTKIFYSLADKANDFDSDDVNGQSSQYGKGKFRSARNALTTGKTVSRVEYWGTFSKIRDLVKNVDYDVVQNGCEYRIYYYRSFYDQINNTLNQVKVIYTDGTSVFFINLDETSTGVFEEALRCIHQRELEARAIGHVAALYQLFWDRTHAVRWSSGSPPSTMISGEKYSVSWIVASGNSISHTNVHWDTDPARLKTTNALDSTFNECSSPCTPRTFTNSISSNPIVAPAPGTYYFVAHAKIDGFDAWSDVVLVTVLPSSPTIGRNPSTMTFSGVQGGSNPTSQTLSITNTGGGLLSWSVSDNASWLNLSPPSGTTTTETDSVTVSVSTSGLGAGSYSATITISAAGATNTPQMVAVNLTVNPASPTIGRNPATLSFSGTQGGSNPPSQTLAITNNGGGTLNWSLSDNASWLNLSPSSGTTTTETDSITVSVNSSGLGAGNYSATITISAAGATNTPQTVAVSLTIGGVNPAIGRSPTTMSFSGVEGGANPSSQTLSITNTGGGTLNWSLSDNASWLNLSPSSGITTTETDSVTVNANSSGLGAGNYSATITISAPGATNTPQTVSVNLALSEQPGGGGCGRLLVQQPRSEIGGCDASDTGEQWWVAENFRLAERRDVSCLEVLGYYWPYNDPPPSSVLDVVFYEVASNGTPGAVVHEDRGVHVFRQKTGNVLGGMDEWRFAVELTTPVDLVAGDYFVEVAGAAGTGGGFCWSEGQIDPVAGLSGLAFRNTGQWSLGNWNLALKVFEKPEPTDLYTLAPCRVVDTRNPAGVLGGPALSSGNLRTFTLAGHCGIPVGAEAVVMNVTVVNADGAGYLTLFPGDQMVPKASSINFLAGQTRANNAIIQVSSNGALAVWPSVGGNGQVDFIIDVVGYFAAGGLAGLWQGWIAGHPDSSLEIRDEGGASKAWVVVAGEQPPEEMTNVTVLPSTFQGIRPRDNNAELRLILDASTSPSCLNGEYLEMGTSRPVALCRVQ